MSLAQRLAWLDGLATASVVAVALTVWPPAVGAVDAWGLAARVALVALVCVALFYYNDLYDFEQSQALSTLFVRLCRALGLAALVLALAFAALPGVGVNGSVASYALLVTLVTLLTVRAGLHALAHRRLFAERVVIMGGGRLAVELARHLRTRPDLNATLVGFLAEADADGGGAPRLGAYGDIGAVVAHHQPDRIIVAMPDRRGTLPVSDLLACRVRGIRIEDGPQAYERCTRRLAVESLTPGALVFGDGFRVSRTQLAVKRVLSVGVALAGLAVTAPLMALAAVLIKLESPGPVLFVQERIGLGGRPFRLLKFRTMRALDPAHDDVWARDNASRVTRVGAVLRRYRLDEIPQFVNILRGDMSLVGPRPEMAGNVATFAAVIPFYSLRHEVRPGLTGWAQVKAGYSMSTEEVTRKLCYDLYYIKHLSVRFDLRILVDTVKFVLGGKRPG
jgi:exopolysaccharide biosynthesis polyprenyl glycosylphosphotransferase